MKESVCKEEWALIIAHKMLIKIVNDATKTHSYTHALHYISEILAPILDKFFKVVRINDGDPDLRMNRLRLLKSISKQCFRIADFSRLKAS